MHYLTNSAVQFALNLPSAGNYVCIRTLENYVALMKFEEEKGELARDLFHKITAELCEILEQNVSKQRLDSTHVFSDMATFGRTRLMGVTIKRFLTQLKRHDLEALTSLPAELVQRYDRSSAGLFAEVSEPEDRARLRLEVARDLNTLIRRFENDENHQHRDTFKCMCRIFNEQCEIVEDTIDIKQKPGGDCMQNPSDPEATYDGHKGPGYQVQLAETFDSSNETQLITALLPQTAVESDAGALDELMAQWVANGLMPEQAQMDTHYGHDANDQLCLANGIDMISPVPGPKVDTSLLNSDDFPVDDTGKIISCPAGVVPETSKHDPETGETSITMPASDCSNCDFADECPIRAMKNGGYGATFSGQQQRLDRRRREEETDGFKEIYRKRSGIEATNSSMKRRTGMSRLRVRGSPSVFLAIIFKVIGWNILRAAGTKKMRLHLQAKQG